MVEYFFKNELFLTICKLPIRDEVIKDDLVVQYNCIIAPFRIDELQKKLFNAEIQTTKY